MPGFGYQHPTGSVLSAPQDRPGSWKGTTGTSSSCMSGGHTNDSRVQASPRRGEEAFAATTVSEEEETRYNNPLESVRRDNNDRCTDF